MKAVNIILLPKKSLTFKQRGGFVSQDDGGGQVWSLRPGNLAFNDSAQKSHELPKKQINLTLYTSSCDNYLSRDHNLYNT